MWMRVLAQDQYAVPMSPSRYHHCALQFHHSFISISGNGRKAASLSLSWDSIACLAGPSKHSISIDSLLHEHSFLSSYHLIDVSDHDSEHIIVISGYEFCFKWSLSSRSNLPHFMAIFGPILCICSHEEYWKAFWRWFHQSLMHEHRKKPHYRAKSPSPKVSPFSEPRLESQKVSKLLIRVGTLLFFHSGAIYHVHREHGDLTRNLSTNTATADNSKHISDPKTLSFTRNDPLRTSVPSRGWDASIASRRWLLPNA